VPTPPCDTDSKGVQDTVEPSEGPGFSTEFDSNFTKLIADLAKLQTDPNEAAKYTVYKNTADLIQQKRSQLEPYVQQWMAAVPATLTKQSPDMQNFYVALLNAPDSSGTTVPLGVLYGPATLDPAKAVRKYLGVPVPVFEAFADVLSTFQPDVSTRFRIFFSIPLTRASEVHI
jgi:oligoendopeptidase F